MKKLFTIFAVSIFLVACGQNSTTPTNTQTNQSEKTNISENTKNTPIKTEENTANHKTTFKNTFFEVDLPEGFIAEADEYNKEAIIIKKLEKDGTKNDYFALEKYSKAEQEQMKKCETVKMPRSMEEFEAMTPEERKNYEPCQGPTKSTNPDELTVFHITSNGDFWLVNAGHEIPVNEKNPETYAKTLEKFGVKEKITDSHGSTNLVPEELVKYFKDNTRFQ